MYHGAFIYIIYMEPVIILMFNIQKPQLHTSTALLQNCKQSSQGLHEMFITIKLISGYNSAVNIFCEKWVMLK